MKKLSSLILLILFLVFSDGYITIFRVRQLHLRNEMKHEINDKAGKKELSVIAVNKNQENEITWIKKGKEFRYRDELYDVVDIKTTGNKRVYYCINDEKEEHLIETFKKDHSTNEKVVWRQKRIPGNKYQPESISLKPDLYVSDCIFMEYLNFYKSRFTDASSPPPRGYINNI
jgi:hypothetical protein